MICANEWASAKSGVVEALVSEDASGLTPIIEVLERCCLALMTENDLEEFDTAYALLDSAVTTFKAKTNQRYQDCKQLPTIVAFRLLRFIAAKEDGNFHAEVCRISEDVRNSFEVMKVIELHEMLLTGRYETFRQLCDQLAATGPHFAKMINRIEWKVETARACDEQNEYRKKKRGIAAEEIITSFLGYAAELDRIV